MRKLIAMGLFVVGIGTGFSDELRAYELGVRDTAVFIERLSSQPVPGPGYWVLIDATDIPFPRAVLLMRFMEVRGYRPAYAWKGGRDYIIVGSFARQRDAERAVEELESYGIKGAYVKDMRSRLDRITFRRRLVSSVSLCRYPEYRGIEGIKKLIEQAKELAYDVEDPAFNRDAFVQDLKFVLKKIKDYEKYRKEEQAGTGDSYDDLIEKAVEWKTVR